jgi:hypothetical protein
MVRVARAKAIRFCSELGLQCEVQRSFVRNMNHVRMMSIFPIYKSNKSVQARRREGREQILMAVE